MIGKEHTEESLKQDLEHARKEVDDMMKSTGHQEQQLVKEAKEALDSATAKVQNDLDTLKQGNKIDPGKSQSSSALDHVKQLIASFKSKIKETLPVGKKDVTGPEVPTSDVPKEADVQVVVKPEESTGVVHEIQETIQGVKELMEDSLEEGKRKGGEAYEAVRDKVLAGVDTIKGIATSTKQSATETAAAGVHKATEKAKDVVEGGKEVAQHGVETGKSLLSSLTHTVKEKVGFGVEKAKEAAEVAKDSASETAESAKEKAMEGVEHAKDTATGVAGSVKEKAKEGVEAAKGAAQETKEKAKQGLEQAKATAESTAQDAREKAQKGAEKLKETAETSKPKKGKKTAEGKPKKGMTEKIMGLMGKEPRKEEVVVTKAKPEAVKVEVGPTKEGVSKLSEKMGSLSTDPRHTTETGTRRHDAARQGKHGR